MKQTIILIAKVFFSFSFFFLAVSLPYFVFLIPSNSLLNPEEHGGHIFGACLSCQLFSIRIQTIMMFFSHLYACVLPA